MRTGRSFWAAGAVTLGLVVSACSASPATSPSPGGPASASSSTSSTPTTPAPPPTVQTALEKVKAAVAKVTVSSWGSPDRFEGWASCNVSTGTSFAIAPTFLVTSAHVVEGHDRIRVTWQGLTQPGTVVGYDRDRDLALLQVVDAAPGFLQWRAEDAKVGEEVATYGYTWGASSAFLDGNVNRVNQKADIEGHYMTGLMETDFATQPGNSGGPVFDKDAAVVGIITAGLPGEPRSRLSVPASRAEPYVSVWVDAHREDPSSSTTCKTLAGEAEPEGEDPPELTKALHSAAMTLLTYVNAINDGDYVTAHAQLANGGDLENFTKDVETSRIDWLTYGTLTDDPTAPALDLTFRSRQESGKGPTGRPQETCTLWHNHYTFAARNGMWLIDKSLGQAGVPRNEPCPSTGDPTTPVADIGD